MRRIAAIVGLIGVMGVALGLHPARAGADPGFVGWTNQVRAARGLAPLAWNGVLAAKAQGWAAHMASGGCAPRRICHSRLSAGNNLAWVRLGENVGVGPTDDALGIQRAFEASPSHLANIVDPRFDYVGVGTATVGGELYVAVEFMDLPTAPAAAPSTGTRPSSLPRSAAPAETAPSTSPRPQPPVVAAPSASASEPPRRIGSPPSARLVDVLDRLRRLGL
mgnify:CR=1 FL=1